jgi:hypothetical protein
LKNAFLTAARTSSAEGRHDRRSGRQVEHERQADAAGRDQRAHRPADRQPRPQAGGEEHRRHRGHDEEAEDEEHAGDGHRGGHHEAERDVEQEVPEADVQTPPLGLRLVHRDQQEAVAEDVVEGADQRVEDGRLRQLRPGHREDVADQHLLQVLGLLGGLRHHQDGHRGRHRVDDADHRLLRDAGLPVDAREGEDGRPQEGEAEREEVGRRGVQVVAGEIGDGGSQGGDLGEREIDEDHAALDHVHAQVGVDAGQDQARDEGGQQQLEDAHFAPFIAAAKASMSVSNSVK